jgi:hypothetical protein
MDLLRIFLFILALLALGWALFFGLFLAAAWLVILVFSGLGSIWVRQARRKSKPGEDSFRLFVARKY